MNLENLCMGCMANKGNLDLCPECGWKEGTLPESPVQLSPRTVLNNQYLLGRVLGQGGFGITYLAWDMNIERKVAVKEYFPQSIATRSGDRSFVSIYSDKNKQNFEYGLSKFLEEAKALAKFQEHPGIVSIITFFEANGTGYLVMEYVDGMTFKEYLEQEGGKIPFETALKIMMQVMDALREIHAAELLHRDISPENIYITGKGRIKLLDFGAARYAMGEHSKSLSVILKDGYAPEEQYRTRGNQGPWTDVYALGATFYRAITGVVPPQALDRMAEDDLQSPAELGVNIPGAVESALMKSLAVKTNERQQTIKEFQDELNRPDQIEGDRKKEEAAFNFAKKMGTEEAVEIYLEQYPYGVYAAEARKILRQINRAALEAREKEREVFEMAEKLGTLKAYKVFLEDFPDGKYADRAKKRIAELSGKRKTKAKKKKPAAEAKSTGIMSRLWSKINIGALWMVSSIPISLIMAIVIINYSGVSITSRYFAAGVVFSLFFISGIVLAFFRRKVMNGVEMACYWIGLSFTFTMLFSLLFGSEYSNFLTGITIGLVISIISGISLAIKRRKMANGLEIALYWLYFSTIIAAFFFAFFQLARISWTTGSADPGWGLLLGLVISIITGIIFFVKRIKAAGVIESFIYWLGLSCAFTGAITAFFEILKISLASIYTYSGYGYYNYGEWGAVIGLLISLIAGFFIIFKRREAASGLEYFLYWFFFSIQLGLLFSLFFYIQRIELLNLRRDLAGLYSGLLIGILEGVVLLIMWIKNRSRRKTGAIAVQ